MPTRILQYLVTKAFITLETYHIMSGAQGAAIDVQPRQYS